VQVVAAAECALWKKKPTRSAEGTSSVPSWSGKACSDTFFTQPIRSFQDGMSFWRQRGKFLIKLACRWSLIAGIKSHLNLARQRPSKPNWRELLRRRPLPPRPSAALSNHPKIPDDTEVVPPNLTGSVPHIHIARGQSRVLSLFPVCFFRLWQCGSNPAAPGSL